MHPNTMNIKLPKPTIRTIHEACNLAAEAIQKDSCMLSSARSAGFIIPRGQKRGKRRGYQVFVRVVRFDEALLKSKPSTGGLLCE